MTRNPIDYDFHSWSRYLKNEHDKEIIMREQRGCITINIPIVVSSSAAWKIHAWCADRILGRKKSRWWIDLIGVCWIPEQTTWDYITRQHRRRLAYQEKKEYDAVAERSKHEQR